MRPPFGVLRDEFRASMPKAAIAILMDELKPLSIPLRPVMDDQMGRW